MLKNPVSEIKIKNLLIDSSKFQIAFEGGISPFGMEFYILQKPGQSYFRALGDKRLYSWEMTPGQQAIVRKQGGIAVKVLDFLGNESQYRIYKTEE